MVVHTTLAAGSQGIMSSTEKSVRHPTTSFSRKTEKHPEYWSRIDMLAYRRLNQKIATWVIVGNVLSDVLVSSTDTPPPRAAFFSLPWFVPHNSCITLSSLLIILWLCPSSATATLESLVLSNAGGSSFLETWMFPGWRRWSSIDGQRPRRWPTTRLLSECHILKNLSKECIFTEKLFCFGFFFNVDGAFIRMFYSCFIESFFLSWYRSVRRTEIGLQSVVKGCSKSSRPSPEWSDRTRSVRGVEQDKNWSYHNRVVLSSQSSGCLRPATDMSCPLEGPTEAEEFCLSGPPAFSKDDFVSLDSDHCNYRCHYYFCVSQCVSVGWVFDCWQ